MVNGGRGDGEVGEGKKRIIKRKGKKPMIKEVEKGIGVVAEVDYLEVGVFRCWGIGKLETYRTQMLGYWEVGDLRDSDVEVLDYYGIVGSGC